MKEEILDIILDIKSERPREMFLGRCKENAKCLAERIQEKTDYDVILCVGGVKYPGEPTPKNIIQCKQAGIIHWWVKVSSNEEEIIADLSSEIPDNFGQYYLNKNLPRCYTKLDEREL